MGVHDVLKQLVVGIIVGLFWWPDPDNLKPERIQFWRNVIHPDWQEEAKGTVLVRTIVESDERSAGNLAKTLHAELEQHGYELEAEAAGNTVTVWLTTEATMLSERDYAAALLIDLTL